MRLFIQLCRTGSSTPKPWTRSNWCCVQRSSTRIPHRGYATDLEKLKQVVAQCKGCQMHSRQPNRYRAVLPEQCVFNYDVAVDVMFIHQQPILHVLCRQTHFLVQQYYKSRTHLQYGLLL